MKFLEKELENFFKPIWGRIPLPFKILFLVLFFASQITGYTLRDLVSFQNFSKSEQEPTVLSEQSVEKISQEKASTDESNKSCKLKFCFDFQGQSLTEKWVKIDKKLTRKEENSRLFCAQKGGPFPWKSMEYQEEIKPSHQVIINLIPTDSEHLNIFLQFSELYKVVIGDGDMRSVAVYRNLNFPNEKGGYILVPQSSVFSSSDKGFFKEPLTPGKQHEIKVESGYNYAGSQLKITVSKDNEDSIIFTIDEIELQPDYTSKMRLGFYTGENKETCSQFVQFDLL